MRFDRAFPDLGQGLRGERRLRWIETLIEVNDPFRGEYVPMIANPMQRHIINTLSSREITLKSRRAGLTSIYVADTWIDICTIPGIKAELIAHNQDTANEIFDQVVRVQYERIPMEFRPRATTDTVNSFKFSEIGSSFRVLTAGQSEAVAMKKGQSRVITNLILTEFAFYAYAEALFGKIVNCIPAGQGKIYIDSTPNGQEAFYRRYVDAKTTESSPFRARFYPWWWDLRNSLPLEVGEVLKPTDEEVEDLARNVAEYGNPNPGEKIPEIGITAEQLKFRRHKIRSLMPIGSLTSRDVFVVEYPENDQDCFLHSGRPLFLAKHLVKRTEPRDAIPGHKHSIGHDASTGDASGHPAGSAVIDLDTGEQVYEWRGWKPTDSQAEDLVQLQKRYPGIIVPERNTPGDSIITLLRRWGVKKVYRHRDREMKEHTATKAWERKPGFPMSDLTKPRVFTELEHAISHGDLLLCGQKTIDDLKGYQYNDSDRIEFLGTADHFREAGELSHGELGISLGLAWWGRKAGSIGVA